MGKYFNEFIKELEDELTQEEKEKIRILQENWNQHDFLKEPLFIGMFTGHKKILQGAAANGDDLELLGFRDLNGNMVGIIKNYRFSDLLDKGELAVNTWYGIEYLGKKEMTGGRSIGLWDIYEIPEEIISKVKKDEDIPF
ncbi:MAG: hypothetical protein ACTSVV_14460 [Promethearchaeota archaeon]